MKNKKTENKQEGKAAKLDIQRLALDVLKPHPENPRKHPASGSPEWEALRRSLESDYFDPVVWNRRNGMLVSGHLRVKVLKELGFTEADCVVVDYDELTHKARMMAANKLQGRDDEEALAKLLEEVTSGGVDCALAGVTEKELEELIGGAEMVTPESSAKEIDVDCIQLANKCPRCGFEFDRGVE